MREQMKPAVETAPRKCQGWVKAGKAHCEDMFSALPPRADIAQRSRHVRLVPISDRRGGLRPIVPVLHILFPGTGPAEHPTSWPPQSPIPFETHCGNCWLVVDRFAGSGEAGRPYMGVVGRKWKKVNDSRIRTGLTDVMNRHHQGGSQCTDCFWQWQ
jgi:hypothetical protein